MMYWVTTSLILAQCSYSCDVLLYNSLNRGAGIRIRALAHASHVLLYGSYSSCTLFLSLFSPPLIIHLSLPPVPPYLQPRCSSVLQPSCTLCALLSRPPRSTLSSRLQRDRNSRFTAECRRCSCSMCLLVCECVSITECIPVELCCAS